MSELDGDRMPPPPYLMVCTGSGGGTTTVGRTIIAKLLNHGAIPLVLDTKRISHRGRGSCRRLRTAPTSSTSTTPGWTHGRTPRHIDSADQHGGDRDCLPRLAVVFEAADALNQISTRAAPATHARCSP